jgi:hypothetical protein
VAGSQAGPSIDTSAIKPVPKLPVQLQHNVVRLPACPDLQAGLAVRNTTRNGNGSFNFDLVAQVKNVGTGNYLSGPNQQAIVLAEAAGSNPLRQGQFQNLNTGQQFQTLYRVRNYWTSTEFFTGYRVSLQFDPDIRLDGNPNNDECGPRNNTAVMSQDQLNRALGG